MEPYDRLAHALEKLPSSRATLCFSNTITGQRITLFVRRGSATIELMHHQRGCITLERGSRDDWRARWADDTPFFKWFLCRDYQVTPALIDQVELLFQHQAHRFRPVQVRLAFTYRDGKQRRIRAVCTMFNAVGSDEYTVRIEYRGEHKSLRDCMAFLVRDELSITGSSATGDVKTLVWFLNRPFKLTPAGGLRESCDQYTGGPADWTRPCSDFYFIRAGYAHNAPRQMSPEMRRYVNNPALFRLPSKIKEHVLAMCSITHMLNGREENLTIRRLFTQEDKAGKRETR